VGGRNMTIELKDEIQQALPKLQKGLDIPEQ
jgi:hypothetical protein